MGLHGVRRVRPAGAHVRPTGAHMRTQAPLLAHMCAPLAHTCAPLALSGKKMFSHPLREVDHKWITPSAGKLGCEGWIVFVG